MTNHLVNSTKNTLPKTYINKKKSSGSNKTIWHVGAGIGLLGGTLLLFGGGFLVIFQYFSGEKPLGIWLFLIVLPLWILGAHCFDRIEEIDKAGRIEYCKQHGITNSLSNNSKRK